MRSTPTLKIILDKRRIKDNKRYPVKLRVTYERKHRYYPTGKDLIEGEFERAYGAKPRAEYKELREYLKNIEAAARRAMDAVFLVFSFENFEAEYYKGRVKKSASDLSDAYSAAIDAMLAEGRTGNADAYKCSKESIWKFKGPRTFSQITPEFLFSYERWMLDRGRSITTVGIYLRPLRTLFNDAIKSGIIPESAYPFGNKKPLYDIPIGRNIKKALTRDDLKKIFEYKPETESETRARDFWIFIYLSNGVNPKDIAELQYKNLDTATQKITVIRAKTKRTNRNTKRIEIFLQPMAFDILKRYANKSERPDDYVFSVLTPGSSALQQDKDVAQFVKNINEPMAKIALKLGIDKKVTTGTARHSFASMLKWANTSVLLISESMGHRDIKTTENYLASFEDATKRNVGAALLNFKEGEE